MEEYCQVESDARSKDKDGFSNLSLRPFDLSDIDDFMVWASDERVARYCPWEQFTNKEDGLNYIKNTVLPHPWFRAICLDNTPIGAILVKPKKGYDEKHKGEIGYCLDFKYWGKGIVTQAVKMVVRTIFLEWPHLERLQGLVEVENVGSQRVLEKAGFHRECVLRKYMNIKGKVRDLVMFSLLSTDLSIRLSDC